jgi:hypothetical protein
MRWPWSTRDYCARRKIKGVPHIVIITRAARELADSDGCGTLSKKFEGSFKKRANSIQCQVLPLRRVGTWLYDSFGLYNILNHSNVSSYETVGAPRSSGLSLNMINMNLTNTAIQSFYNEFCVSVREKGMKLEFVINCSLA